MIFKPIYLASTLLPVAAWHFAPTAAPTFVPAIPSASSGSPCKDTANEAYQACLKQAMADYYNQRANCSNLPTTAERAQCDFEALSSLSEAISECKDQRKARLEVCSEIGHGIYDPEIDPQDFVDGIDNPYLPLAVGNHWVYKKVTGSGIETTDVTVLAQTKEILGVECTIVRDVVSLDGELVEDTVDWFAQDKHGNVWYFGELALDYEDGEIVSIGGSWTSGVDGAKPGIVMPGVPKVDDFYRQEFLINEAEDVFEIEKLNATVDVPYGHFVNCLETEDSSPLEPGKFELKYYYPGVGRVLEISGTSGSRNELISFSHN